MAAHEKARPGGGNGLDRFPGLHVDHVDGAVFEVRAGQHGGAVPGKGDARAQVRHACNRQLGNLAPYIEVDHLCRGGAVGRTGLGPGRAQHMAVVLVEKEIVQRFIERRAANPVVARLGDGLAHLVVVYQAVIDRRCLGVVGNLPDLRNVLERHDKTLARGSVVHRRHARGLFAVERGGVIAFDKVQIGVEQHHGARQVVGGHDPAPVAADGHVAHVQAGAHLGHHGKVPQVVFGDPAVARAKEHKAPVGRELGAAVQRVAAGKAVNDLETVAIDQRDMVVAALDHHKQVHGIGLPAGAGRQVSGACGFNARGAHIVVAPRRCGGDRLVDPFGQCRNVCGGQRGGEAPHLRGGAALLDDLQRFGAAQACQALGQQRRAHAASALGTVAAGAVFAVQRGSRGGGGGRGRLGGRR